MTDPVRSDLFDIHHRLDDAEKLALESSHVEAFWINIDGKHEFVMSYSSLDLEHIEASLARRFGIQHFRLLVGSVFF